MTSGSVESSNNPSASASSQLRRTSRAVVRFPPAGSVRGSIRGFHLRLRPWLRARRRLHHAGLHRRPRSERRSRARRRPATATTRASPSRSSRAVPQGYAIDDLVLQDPLLDAVARPSRRSSAASADLRPVLVVGAPLAARQPALQLRRRDPPRRGARRRAEVLPADLPRVLRAALVRPRRRPPRPHDPARRPRGAVRPRPALRGRPTCPASSSTSRSARTCGCRSRPAPRRRWPAPRCCQPLRQPHHGRPAPRTAGCWSASASPRCLAAYALRRRGPGRVDARTCRGTARR